MRVCTSLKEAGYKTCKLWWRGLSIIRGLCWTLRESIGIGDALFPLSTYPQQNAEISLRANAGHHLVIALFESSLSLFIHAVIPVLIDIDMGVSRLPHSV